MSKIKMLSETVCNKIAAGEVVERPASIVKELLENALDAGATKVSVTIEKAGQTLISVLDNGEGMDEDDALLCFDSHATSKIFTEEDIFTISSFGFRGEAIPSIASISRMTVKTRRRESAEGVEVTVHGGRMLGAKPVGCAPGTEMIVRDMFFNVPARRKFLKTVATEERHIIEMLTNISLAHPHVAFELRCDGRLCISSPGSNNLLPRIRQLFGREYGDSLIPISKTDYGIEISGYISRRSYTKASRQDQRIFVNGRPIESAAIYRGIRDGCGPTLEKGRFRVAILFLSMNPEQVDVNVHPAKREVRFKNEFEVIAAVRSAVTSALRAGDPVIPYTSEASGGSADSVRMLFPDYPAASENAPKMESYPLKIPGTVSVQTLEQVLRLAQVDYQVCNAIRQPSLVPLSERNQADKGQDLIPETDKQEAAPPSFRLERDETPKSPVLGAQGLKILGLLENSYIIASIPGGLVLIDQHAAHERVLFERILKSADASLSQKLLIPITLEMSRSEMAFLMKNTEEFEKNGFEIDAFGENTLKLNAIPAAIPQENAGGVFRDMISRIIDTPAPASRLEKDIIARAACKAAVKAHDRLSLEECEALIHQMAQCEMPFSCPHGRPTVLNITLSEIERRFGRKQ